MLRIEELRGPYGPVLGRPRRRPQLLGRQHRHAGRPERRREVHHPRQPSPARAAARSSRDPSSWRAVGARPHPEQRVARRHRAGARGPPHLHAAHRRGEPPARAPWAAQGAEERLARPPTRASLRWGRSASGRRPLSGGEQQHAGDRPRAADAGRALLLLDEPSLGLAPKIVDQVFETIVELRAAGVTILLVEQNAARAAEFADRSYVLRSGTIAGQRRGGRRPGARPSAYFGSSGPASS